MTSRSALSGNSYAPVAAGLAAGMLLVVVFAFAFKPAFAKTDGELIAETRNLPKIQYLVSRYPDAMPLVDRQKDNTVIVSYQVERQRCFPTGNFGDDCTRILSFDVIMGHLNHARVEASCLGPISYTFVGDPIEYVERGGCFGLEVTLT